MSLAKAEIEDGMQIIEATPEVPTGDASGDDIDLNRLRPSKILSVLKAMLRSSIYEDSDFKMGKHSVSIDLQYDSKYTRNVYFNELRKRFPGMVTITGTRIKIVPQSNKNMGTPNDTGSSTQVKEDRWNEKSKKSLPRNEAYTHRRGRPPLSR